MPLRDVAAQNASLDNDYGTTKGPNAPASHEVALFFGDPLEEGVEINATDCPGYARLTIANDGGWPPASAGEKNRTVQFPDTTDAWNQTVTHWALIAAGEVMWDTAELAEPVTVTGAGTWEPIVLSVFHDNSLGLDL